RRRWRTFAWRCLTATRLCMSIERRPRGRAMQPTPEEIHGNGDWQVLCRQVEALRNDVEPLSREAEASEPNVVQVRSAVRLSHLIGRVLPALQQRKTDRLRKKHDQLMKDYIERARREWRVEYLDMGRKRVKK